MTGSEYYLQQLKDPKWKAKSRKVRNRDGNKCTVCGVSKEDIKRLDELGFFISDDDDTFDSFRFGSC